MRHDKSGLKQKLIPLLQTQFDIPVQELTFIPIGEESISYKAISGNQTYFVKWSADISKKETVATIHNLLQELSHLSFIVAPLAATNSETCVEIDKGFITVSPFIEGELVHANNENYPKELVGQLTEILVQIQNATSNIQTELKHENFTTEYEAKFMEILPVSKMAKKHSKKIQELIEKHTHESEYYKQFTPHFFITHGDITQFNILQTNAGIKLLDWDGAMLAPKEADLMFFVDNKHFDQKKYLEEVNQDEIDLKLIEYYKMRWALDSIILGLHVVETQKLGPEDVKEKLNEVEEYLGYV